VRDAVASLARSFKRVSVYRHARDQHAGYLEPAVAEMSALLERQAAVTVSIEPTGLVFDGEVVHTEPARENGFCFRLHRDGVRSITFRRGVGLDELLALAYVTMADPQAEGGREDAVTELWKADLTHVGYSAGAGYRMDESAGEGISRHISEVAGKAQAVLDRHVGERFEESSQRPPIWTDEQRSRADSQDYAGLARRALITILKIVEQDHAGWDLQALQESFKRLCEHLFERGHLQPLAQALDRLRRISDSRAGEFRSAVSRWLSDPARLGLVVLVSDGLGKPPLLPAWLQLLPGTTGATVLALLPQGRDATARLQIAQAAIARVDSCLAQLPDVLRRGRAPEVLALLGAMAPLPPARRAELALAAFENPDAEVSLQAIPLVAGDAASAVRTLGASLTSPSREVRLAAAQALGACAGAAEQAAALLLPAMQRPRFAKSNKEEQSIFYRAVGRLGSNGGYSFLVERLNRPPRRIFGRKKAVETQLLAAQGLGEDTSRRATIALEEAQRDRLKHVPAVVAACRAALQHQRTLARGGKVA
jgi:hypothetical protein